MMTLYVFRERLKGLYQKYDIYLTPALKFILGMIVFSLIGKSIGFDERLTRIPIILLLSLLTAFLSSAVLVFAAAVVSILHIYYASKILSIIAVLFFLILYLLFIRFTPKLGFVVLAVPILFILKIPYVVPMVLGLISTPVAAIPTACGVVIYYLFKVLNEAASLQVGITMDDVLQLYTYVCKSVLSNKQMVMTIVIFSVILTMVYIIRRQKMDYAYGISVAAGAIVNILCFLISDLKLDFSEQIFSMILGTIGSAILAYVILFFKQALDYTAVERVQFEDDDYIYYVKAVPKINVTTPQKNVKRINPQKVRDAYGEETHKQATRDEEMTTSRRTMEYEDITIEEDEL